ncbi:phosphoglycerate dehydrogenase [Isosphaeraceae bacterium EP7]
MPNVLIGPEPLRHQVGAFRDQLIAAGFTPIDPEGNNTLTEEQLRRWLPEADAMIAGGERVSADVIASAKRLRVIARTGVGYDAIDLPTANARSIAVTTTPGTNHEAVAEQAFALLLAVTRNVVNNDRLIRGGGWNRTLVVPLRGRTLGLIGLGRIGRAMVTRAVAFGMRVVAFDSIPDPDFDARHGIVRLDLDSLLGQSDAVSLHLPLTSETHQIINRRSLALMKPGSYLINTARGGLIAEGDLFDALTSGHLAGAGLDVTDPEPPLVDNPLLGVPGVVFSPHIAGIDTRSMADMAELAARCVIDLSQGRWPEECVVNPQIRRGYRWAI